MRSLHIEEIGVTFISFLHINPTPPQPFLSVEFSVSLSSILTSAIKAGWMLHRRSASKGQLTHSDDITATFSQMVYIGFPTTKASAIPGSEI